MKRLLLYNSLSQRKEIFRPRSKDVGMYVCGITPDGLPHFGHAFTYTVFDVLVRYLRHLEYHVTYVQNLTDIDDDLLKRARQRTKNWREFGKKNAREFQKDMKWLNNVWPDVYPKATEHIPEMIRIIQKLLRKRIAYEKNGCVYFSIGRYKDYGKLSRLSKSRMLPTANERGNDPHDTDKNHPLDFVLWQAAKPGEPKWRSPWGWGRPGWHIECSAMSIKYLGQPFDIHGGGGDLIFPHHENSLAQSKTAFGKPLAHYWMHTGMLSYRGKKMSKSLGNLVLLRDLRKMCTPNALRICLLSHHYRSQWEFRKQDLKKAKHTEKLFLKACKTKSQNGEHLSIAKEQDQFYEAMNDDLNTPKALRTLERLAKKITRQKSQNITSGKVFLTQASQILGLQI